MESFSTNCSKMKIEKELIAKDFDSLLWNESKTGEVGANVYTLYVDVASYEVRLSPSVVRALPSLRSLTGLCPQAIADHLEEMKKGGKKLMLKADKDADKAEKAYRKRALQWGAINASNAGLEVSVCTIDSLSASLVA